MGASALSLIMMLAATLLCGTEAQSIGSCSDLFKELTGKGIRVFADSTNPQGSRLKSELCVDFALFRLNRYFYCDEGSSAFIFEFDTPDTRSDLSKVVDVDELRDQLNNSNVAIICVPRPQPPTQRPTPPPPAPNPPSVGRCPRGPTRVNQYLRQDQPGLCKQSCSFGTAVFGISTGSRTRTIYRCCKGEPIPVSRASRLYRCP